MRGADPAPRPVAGLSRVKVPASAHPRVPTRRARSAGDAASPQAAAQATQDRRHPPLSEPAGAAMHLAYIGLGANLGDSRAALAAALLALAALPGTRMLRQSSLYRSAPIESSGPDYLNAVAALDTGLGPHELLHALQAIERDHGRERPYRNAPRTLDLDLLLHDSLTLETPELTLPHPRLHQRAFVLLPLAELAPQLQIPGRGRVAELLAQVRDQPIEKVEP